MKLQKAVGKLILGQTIDGFRSRDWTMRTPTVLLEKQRGFDVARSLRPGDAFSQLDIEINARPLGLSKQYEQAMTLGSSGVALYTGHLWPLKPNGERMSVAFSVNAAAGEYVHIFGQRRRRLQMWRGPFNHPSFLLFGDKEPSSSRAAYIAQSDSVPVWVSNASESIIEEVLNGLARQFDETLLVKPTVFLSFTNGAPRMFGYSGDALPAQFRLFLRDGGWVEPSPFAERLLERGIAHEAFHLWQMKTPPKSRDVSAWIHEGAAEAGVGEALAEASIWSAQERQAHYLRSRTTCVDGLRGETLEEAERSGGIRTVYACGHVLMGVAAAAHNADGFVSALWKSVAQRARNESGFDEATLFAVLEDAGRSDVADAIEDFLGSRLVDVEEAITELEALSMPADAG
ncbi:MAG: hypothetical protein AAF850_11600 [Pseudomonadota bacterium]